jgi:hypothetical protein
MPYPGHTTEEVARLGEEIYEREIREKVEADHEGEFLVVDVTTGSYELDESDVAASDRALAKNPDALLRGSRLRVDVVPGGSVLVEEL